MCARVTALGVRVPCVVVDDVFKRSYIVGVGFEISQVGFYVVVEFGFDDREFGLFGAVCWVFPVSSVCNCYYLAVT